MPDQKEVVLRDYLFDHLWLLDASWERAATNLRVEEAVTKEFADVTESLSDEERRGRIDIRYKTAARKHIIVELKKYDRRVSVEELQAQLLKYLRALEKVLRRNFPSEEPLIEIVSILGQPPTPEYDRKRNAGILQAIRARTITYDELIRDNLERYADYLEKQRELSELADLIERIPKEFQRETE